LNSLQRIAAMRLGSQVEPRPFLKGKQPRRKAGCRRRSAIRLPDQGDEKLQPRSIACPDQLARLVYKRRRDGVRTADQVMRVVLCACEHFRRSTQHRWFPRSQAKRGVLPGFKGGKRL